MGRLARRAWRAPARGKRDSRGGVGQAHGGDGGENTTAARKLTAVSSFWCLGRGDVHANPLADLARSAVDYDTSATPDLTRDQAAALLAAADADAGPRSNGMPPPSALFMHLQVGSRETGGHSPADSQISWTRFPSCARERRPGRYRATSAP